MALTLLEAAKLMPSSETFRATMIEIFAQQTDLLRVMPFQTIPGNALKYQLESTLPGVAFRGLNEAYSESVGVINPQVETLVIAGGDLDVDKFIVNTMGPDQRSVQEAMKLKALAHAVAHKLIKGDSTSDPKEFDGLQRRISGAQVIANGATSGGDPLSLAKLDQAIEQVDGPTHLLMSRAMRRRFTTAQRTTTVGGYVTFDKNEFGVPIMRYNDLEILAADGVTDVNASLAFNEAGSGGGTTATSVYVLSLGDGKVIGLQNSAPMVTDLGELQTKSVYRTRVEWYPGMAIFSPYAASRLSSVSDAAIVA